jgi:MurNAc alpha-1-phosphate uridylyltransferase
MTACRPALPPVCILAGGLGSRLGALTRDVPKPLIPVAGKPFAEYQLELLRRNGAHRVVFCVGYRGDRFEAVLGDGKRFGLELAFSSDGDELLGTAGAVRRALPLLGDRFLVLYGDTFLRIDYRGVVKAFEQLGLPGLMTVLHDRNSLLPSNAVVADDRVLAYGKDEPPPGAEWIDYGLSVYQAGVFERCSSADLAAVQRHLAASGDLAAYVAEERFYEIGTPAGLQETQAFFRDYSFGEEA